MAINPCQVVVAWENNSFDDITGFTTGVQLGVGVWTDISPYVLDASWKRGRQHETQAFQAGTAKVQVTNNDGRFYPWNTASPYAGFLTPGRYIQIRRSAGNLLDEKTADLDLAATGNVAGWSVVSGGTITRDNAHAKNLVWSLKVVTSTTTPLVQTTSVAVRPGQTYTAMAWLATSNNANQARVDLQWVDATNATISTNQGTLTSLPAATAFGQVTVSAVAPATAVGVRMRVMPGGASGLSVWIDQGGIMLGSNVTTWTAGMTPRYTGKITAYPQSWPDNFSQWATIEASDSFRDLSIARIIETGYDKQVTDDYDLRLKPYWYYRLGEPPGSSVVHDVTGTYGGNVFGTVNFGAAGATPDLDTCIDFGKQTPVGCVALDPGVAITQFSGFNNNFQVECWFNSAGDGTPSSTATLIAQYGPTDSTIPAVWSLGITTSGFLFISTNLCADGSGLLAGTDNICDGKWHHLVGVWSNISGTLLMAIYVDGVQDPNVIGPAVVRSLSATGQNVYLGSGTTPGSGGAGFGRLDEVVIATFQISPPELVDHYNFNVLHWQNQTTGTRISTVLGVVNWPTAMQNIDTGLATVAPIDSSVIGTKVLAHLQAVEITEPGALFIDRYGSLRFIARNTITAIPYSSPLMTLGDLSVPAGSSAELPFQPGPTLALDDLDFYNEAVVTPASGDAQHYADPNSTGGPRTRTVATLDVDNFTAYQRAQWEVAHYSTSQTRLRSATVDLTEDSRLPAAVWSAELMALVKVNRHGITGDVFTESAVLEEIDEHWSPDIDTATFALSPTQAQQYWILGTSALDTNTRLAF